MCLVAWGVAPSAARGQSESGGAGADVCPAGRVTTIFVDNHSIFNADDLEAARKLRWAYQLANTLHIKTRESFVRRELLFEEGDCYDPLLLEESGRILRSYGFLAQADVFAVERPDGSKHVVVDTQDEWTTKIDLGVTFDDGLNLEVLDVTEENILGQGVLATGFIRNRRETKDRGGRLELPRVMGTRVDARFGGGTTRIGNFWEQAVIYPFVGEVGRFALREVARRREDLFAFALGGAGEGDQSHVALPTLDQRIELSVARRFGEPGRLTILGVGVSRETVDFDGYPESLELILDNDFGDPLDAPAGFRQDVATQLRSNSTSRLNLFIGQRNLHFVQARGLDPLDGIQDVEIGYATGLTLGKSVDAFSSRGLDSFDDLYARFRGFGGVHPGSSYLFANFSVEGRRAFSDDFSGEGWRDVIGETDVYAYLRSPLLPAQTVFARVSASGGWSTVTPFQLTGGGPFAVRGFREEDFPGGRRFVASLEDRIFVNWPVPDLFDTGFTVFGDVGRVWPGDAPFGADSGWLGTVGAGLRFGFPRGSRTVTRVDLAFPVGGHPGEGPILRITALETLGFIAGFFDPQLERSRRITIGPDSFEQVRR